MQHRQNYQENRFVLRVKRICQEILNNTEVGDEQKQEAVNTMVQMTEISEKEAAAEMLLEAKGFENAIVNLTVRLQMWLLRG